MGFLPFCASALLGILSLILLISTFKEKPAASQVSVFAGKAWKKVILVLGALAVYVGLLPLLGYLPNLQPMCRDPGGGDRDTDQRYPMT